ncbi:hypothetical protein [Bacillus sp. E214]|jgi:hypothetical protein|uniref:hypothetical protein n=1 Tax=Bacillus sp. E214 TaxID=2587156 RepID=UPI0011DF01E0|nr:hypothetical protein [Bacillus sp. E214]
MGREIKFDDDKQELVLTLTGLTTFFALKQKIQMPYPLIKNVLVDYFDAPTWMIRMPGSSISFLNIYEGSYKYQDEWYFLSYSGRIPLVIIELQGHKKYRYIIFQCENPTKTASEIRTHLRDID